MAGKLSPNKSIDDFFIGSRVEIVNDELIVRTQLNKSSKNNIDINKDYAIISLANKDKTLTIKELATLIAQMQDNMTKINNRVNSHESALKKSKIL